MVLFGGGAKVGRELENEAGIFWATGIGFVERSKGCGGGGGVRILPCARAPGGGGGGGARLVETYGSAGDSAALNLGIFICPVSRRVSSKPSAGGCAENAGRFRDVITSCFWGLLDPSNPDFRASRCPDGA